MADAYSLPSLQFWFDNSVYMNISPAYMHLLFLISTNLNYARPYIYLHLIYLLAIQW